MASKTTKTIIAVGVAAGLLYLLSKGLGGGTTPGGTEQPKADITITVEEG